MPVTSVLDSEGNPWPTETFGFTGEDVLWEIPEGITTVWLSGVGGCAWYSGQGEQQEIGGEPGAMAPRGATNCPLDVSDLGGGYLRIRVGGKPPPFLVDWWWADGFVPGAIGGWNGGGNGGGYWGDVSTSRFYASGGGGATTFHLIRPGSDVEELVAVFPGGPGNYGYHWGMSWGTFYVFNRYGPPIFPDSSGIPEYYPGLRGYFDPSEYIVAGGWGPHRVSSVDFSFRGEPVPPPAGVENLGEAYVSDGYLSVDTNAFPIARSNARTPTIWSFSTLYNGFDWDTLDFATPTVPARQTLSPGAPGEVFEGGAGRLWEQDPTMSEAANSVFGLGVATAGGGGGYGGGAAASRVFALAPDYGEFWPAEWYEADWAQHARHGRYLLPFARPAIWPDAPFHSEFGYQLGFGQQGDGPDYAVEHLPHAAAPEDREELLYGLFGWGALDPFGVYSEYGPPAGAPGDLWTPYPSYADGPLGHGSARIQWGGTETGWSIRRIAAGHLAGISMDLAAIGQA